MPRITRKLEIENPELVHRIRMRDPAYARQYERDQIAKQFADEILSVLHLAKQEMGQAADYLVIAPERRYSGSKVAFVRFKSAKQKTQFWKLVNAKRQGLERYVNEGSHTSDD
jgi:hypothetical protein